MKRVEMEADQMPGQDSFLDVITNIVGILILLVLVVGLRTQRSVHNEPDPQIAEEARVQDQLKKVGIRVETTVIEWNAFLDRVNKSHDFDAVPHHLRPLALTAWQVGRAALTGGNEVQILINAVEAYPAKLEAIVKAKESIDAAYYVFHSDSIGRQFRDGSRSADARRAEPHVSGPVDQLAGPVGPVGLAGHGQQDGLRRTAPAKAHREPSAELYKAGCSQTAT